MVGALADAGSAGTVFFPGPGSFGGGWLERWVGEFAEVGQELAEPSADG